MPRMSPSERDAFLAEPGVLMRIATVTPEGRPSVTPAWFLYEEGRIYFTPRRESAWLGHIRKRPDVALCIDEQPLPYRKVLVDGRAEIVHEVGEDEAWWERYRRITLRYVPQDEAEAYLEATGDQPRALCAVALAESRVRSWRMPVDDEPYEGIWHRRYYVPGTKLAGGRTP